MTSSPPPFIIGREQEQLLLRGLLAAAIAGHGNLALISGEAGIGKTTLVDDLVRSAREQGCLVLAGAGYDIATVPPYGPWREMARRYRPTGNLPPLPSFAVDPATQQSIGDEDAFFTRIWQFFAAIADHQPLVLVLEDLHWIDQASIKLLRHVAREASTSRVLIVVTCRDEAVLNNHPIARFLALLVRESRGTHMRLRRLDDTWCRSMITTYYHLPEPATDRLVSFLHDTAQGNPLFALELLRSLESEQRLIFEQDGWRLTDLSGVRVPPLIQQVIVRRLDTLSDEIRSSLEVAAVIGHVVPLTLWRNVAGLSDDRFQVVLESALAAHVLEETTDRLSVQFTHALIRAVIYESIVMIRRHTLHGRIATILEQPPQPDPDTVAYHFQQAGDPRAVDWLIRAGQRAEHIHASAIAVDRWEAALSLLATSPDQEIKYPWLLVRLGFLYRTTNRLRALDYLTTAEASARESGDQWLALYARFGLGVIRCMAGIQLSEGLHDLETALRLSRDLARSQREQGTDHHLGLEPDIPLLTVQLRISGVLVSWLARVGRYREAVRLGEESIRQHQTQELTWNSAEPSLLASGWIDTYTGLGIAQASLGNPEQAHAMFVHARQLYRQVGHFVNLAFSAELERWAVVKPYLADQPSEYFRLDDEWNTAVASSKHHGTMAPRWSAAIIAPPLITEEEWAAALALADA